MYKESLDNIHCSVVTEKEYSEGRIAFWGYRSDAYNYNFWERSLSSPSPINRSIYGGNPMQINEQTVDYKDWRISYNLDEE